MQRKNPSTYRRSKNHRGTTIVEELVQASDCIDISFLCEHKLTTSSELKYFIEALFLYKEKKFHKKEIVHEHKTVEKGR